MTGIYGIHNTITDTWYVGQASDVQKRWGEHRSTLKHNNHHNQYLQRSYNKYGESAFEYVILQESSIDELNDLECKWIIEKDSFDNGFNLTLGGDGIRGYKNDYNVSRRKQIVLLETGEVFDSVTEACKSKGLLKSRLSWCINHNKAHYGHWEIIPDNYSDEWRSQRLKERTERPKKEPYLNPNGYHKWSESAKERVRKNHGNGKKVYHYSADGVLLGEYHSACEASRQTGIPRKKIQDVLDGTRKQYHGFWTRELKP